MVREQMLLFFLWLPRHFSLSASTPFPKTFSDPPVSVFWMGWVWPEENDFAISLWLWLNKHEYHETSPVWKCNSPTRVFSNDAWSFQQSHFLAESLPVCSVFTTNQNDVCTSLHPHAHYPYVEYQQGCCPHCTDSVPGSVFCTLMILSLDFRKNEWLCTGTVSLLMSQGPEWGKVPICAERRWRMWEVTQIPSKGTENAGELSWQDFSKLYSFFFKIFLLHWFYYATEAVVCANYLLLIA